MSKWAKFWDKISAGQLDNNIDYAELEAYLERLGWETESAKTSHRYYKHPLVAAPVNCGTGKYPTSPGRQSKGLSSGAGSRSP